MPRTRQINQQPSSVCGGAQPAEGGAGETQKKKRKGIIRNFMHFFQGAARRGARGAKSGKQEKEREREREGARRRRGQNACVLRVQFGPLLLRCAPRKLIKKGSVVMCGERGFCKRRFGCCCVPPFVSQRAHKRVQLYINSQANNNKMFGAKGGGVALHITFFAQKSRFFLLPRSFGGSKRRGPAQYWRRRRGVDARRTVRRTERDVESQRSRAKKKARALREWVARRAHLGAQLPPPLLGLEWMT